MKSDTPLFDALYGDAMQDAPKIKTIMTIPLQIVKLQAAGMEQATVSLEKAGDIYRVIRSLPAGMDIAPDMWRFKTRDAAENKFAWALRSVERYGFYAIQTATY